MKFMMIVKATNESAMQPVPAELAAMDAYNDELQKAGILLDLAGLHPTSKAVRMTFEGKQRTITDGPFSETKEMIAGYWVIQVKSREEAIEWAKRIPFGTQVHPNTTVEVELRQLFEPEDFSTGEAFVQATRDARA